MQFSNNPVLDLLEAEQKGVDLICYNKDTAHLALSADFFRDQYQGGLKDTLVVFSARESADTDMAAALEGSSSLYLAWSWAVNHDAALTAAIALFEGLATGLTAQEVIEGMGDAARDPQSGAELVLGSRKLRIRELLTVTDGITGHNVATSNVVGVSGEPGDGQPDDLLLEARVDGLTAATAAGFTLHLEVDGRDTTFKPSSPPSGPAPVTWTVDGEVVLGRDVRNGDTIRIKAWVDLPEGGTSGFEVSPKVDHETSEVGTRWEGTGIMTTQGDGPHVVGHVNAVWERGPTDAPGTLFPSFVPTGGTATWSISGSGPGPNACSHSGQVTFPVRPENTDGELRFDVASRTYLGSAVTEGPMVTVTKVCPTKTETYRTRATVHWFLAQSEANHAHSGSTISGLYDSGARRNTHIEWRFTRVK